MCIINNDFLYFGRKLSDLHFIFAADMKLQELLRKCDFDKMFEYIVKFDSKSEGSRFAYLVAYELLCDMAGGLQLAEGVRGRDELLPRGREGAIGYDCWHLPLAYHVLWVQP